MTHLKEFMIKYVAPTILGIVIGVSIIIFAFWFFEPQDGFEKFVTLAFFSFLTLFVWAGLMDGAKLLCNALKKDAEVRDKISKLEKKEIDAIVKWYEEKDLEKYDER